MNSIDIVEIKQAIKQGQLTVYTKEEKIYLKNDIGEVVEIGKINNDKEKEEMNRLDMLEWECTNPND